LVFTEGVGGSHREDIEARALHAPVNGAQRAATDELRRTCVVRHPHTCSFHTPEKVVAAWCLCLIALVLDLAQASAIQAALCVQNTAVVVERTVCRHRERALSGAEAGIFAMQGPTGDLGPRGDAGNSG